MVKFRSEWRDLAGWSDYKVPLSSPSDMAVKLYDATLDQMLYYYSHPQLGGVGETLNRMLREDPDFVAGNLLRHSLEMFVSNSQRARQSFDEYVSNTDMEKLNDWEKAHIRGVQYLYKEDLVGAMDHYYDICSSYPHDLHSFNFAYILGLVTGHSSYLRDVPLTLIEHYKPHMPHYGLIQGKLCFGYAEMGEYSLAMQCGETALDVFPLDSWAVHAMAHTYENQALPRQETQFLGDTLKHWSRGVNFRQHIDWHHANAYVQLQEYETALTIYDDHIALCASGGDVFPLSDASSFLARLHIDGQSTGNREDQLSRLWSVQNKEFTSLFYNGHSALAAAMSHDTASLETLRENMREYIGNTREGWNKLVTSSHGMELLEGMSCFSDGDFAGAATAFQSCVPELVRVIHGSKAQKSIFSLTYVHCALKSGVNELMCAAQKHMLKQMESNKVDTLPPIQQRLWDKIQLQLAQQDKVH